jgi:hypothetical protein
MVVIRLALALSDNPPNLLTRLPVGTTAAAQWIVLGVTYIIILDYGFVTHRYAEITGRSNHAGKKKIQRIIAGIPIPGVHR